MSKFNDGTSSLTPYAGAMEQRRTPTLLAGAAPQQDAVRVWSPNAKLLHRKARGFVAVSAYIYLMDLLLFPFHRILPDMFYGVLQLPLFIGLFVAILWLFRNLGSVSYQLFGLPYCVSTDAEGFAIAGCRRSQQRRWSDVTACIYMRLAGRILVYADRQHPVAISLAGYSDEDREALLKTIVENAALPVCYNGRGPDDIYGNLTGWRARHLCWKSSNFYSLIDPLSVKLRSFLFGPLHWEQPQKSIAAPKMSDRKC